MKINLIFFLALFQLIIVLALIYSLFFKEESIQITEDLKPCEPLVISKKVIEEPVISQEECKGEYGVNWDNCYGTFSSPDGAKYVGQWKKGMQHGYGTYTGKNGSYVGQWLYGKQDGYGTLTYSSGMIYSGEWYEDEYHGQGTLTLPDGASYVGTWNFMKMHGYGTFTYPDCTKYIGEFRNDRKHGQGTLTLPDGKKIEGRWKNDKHNPH